MMDSWYPGALAWAASSYARITSQITGSVVLLGIPVLLILWRQTIHRALVKKLNVRVTRDPALARQANLHNATVLRFLELRACADVGLPLLSLGQYMASLKAHGTVSMEGAVVSIMEKHGLRLALPLVLFAPQAWRNPKALHSAFQGTPYGGLALINALSPLDLLAVSTTAQRYNIDLQKHREGSTPAEAAKQPGPTALEIMIQGAHPLKHGGLTNRIPNPFRLPGDITADGIAAEDLACDAPVLVQGDADPLHPLFPDLTSGSPGLRMLCGPAQAAATAAFAALLNRLAANCLLDGACPVAPAQRFRVQLPDGQEVTSVEDLIAALEGRGHSVEMYMASNITSFGAGLCLQEDSLEERGGKRWVHIPLAYPLSTGLFARAADGTRVDVTTLMTHACVRLDVKGPLVTANVEWCLSIEATTGWLPETGVYRPWQVGPGAVKRHSEEAFASAAGRRRALRLLTTSSAVLNAAAARESLLLGGYGFLGVCIDSVAAVQHALVGHTTLYPLILGGDAKMALLHEYSDMQTRAAAAGKKWEYHQEAVDLRRTLASPGLPCDAVVEPMNAVATAQRALASLPEGSVFAGVDVCKRTLQAAIDAAREVGPL